MGVNPGCSLFIVLYPLLLHSQTAQCIRVGWPRFRSSMDRISVSGTDDRGSNPFGSIQVVRRKPVKGFFCASQIRLAGRLSTFLTAFTVLLSAAKICICKFGHADSFWK
jgi:hypothetical protein